ncbi:MAG: hypothetical protein LBI68_01800, partial [Azoarcus sp.]|nr:hypothetical protein [Azoarcus sp.]
MKRSAGPNNTPRALCRCALASSMLLALPVSFAQNNPVQNTRNEAVSKSILERGKNNGKNASMGVFIPNLPLSGFLASYNSKDSEERIAAHTFLLGVSDATEGKVWCSYYKFKSIT